MSHDKIKICYITSNLSVVKLLIRNVPALITKGSIIYINYKQHLLQGQLLLAMNQHFRSTCIIQKS